LHKGYSKTLGQIQRYGLGFSSEWGILSFLDDLWFGVVPKHAFPELYSFTKNPNMTLQTARMSPSLIQTFHLPLSTEAYQQFIQLEQTMNVFWPSQFNDTWSYIWGRQEFSCARAYRQLSGSACESI
jgi:hypothetical protein